MVGSTNRWRLPESLGSDLLGSSQAIKAVHMSYNNSLVNIITGKHFRTLIKLNQIMVLPFLQYMHTFHSYQIILFAGHQVKLRKVIHV